MNSFTASAIGAVFLAAALTTLTTLLWPGDPIALMIAATIAIFLNGWLAARLVRGGAKPSQQSQPTPKKQTQSKNAPKQQRERRPARDDSDDDGPTQLGDETGTVKWFNRNKGFGFIVRESGEEIFVHQRSINRVGQGGDRHRPTLKDGQSVRFSVSDHEKGLQAENVSVED